MTGNYEEQIPSFPHFIHIMNELENECMSEHQGIWLSQYEAF